MKIQEIKDKLNLVPKTTPQISDLRGSYINIIVNSENDNNIGFSIVLTNDGLVISKFMREPYRSYNIMTGYEKLTIKQRDYIRKYLIETYLPQFEYLL